MAIDPALKLALIRAVEDVKQPATIAPRLEAWLERLSEGDNSQDAQKRNYDAVFDHIQVERSGED